VEVGDVGGGGGRALLVVQLEVVVQLKVVVVPKVVVVAVPRMVVQEVAL